MKPQFILYTFSRIKFVVIFETQEFACKNTKRPELYQIQAGYKPNLHKLAHELFPAGSEKHGRTARIFIITDIRISILIFK